MRNLRHTGISIKKAGKAWENLNFFAATAEGRSSDAAAQWPYPWLRQQKNEDPLGRKWDCDVPKNKAQDPGVPDTP